MSPLYLLLLICFACCSTSNGQDTTASSTWLTETISTVTDTSTTVTSTVASTIPTTSTVSSSEKTAKWTRLPGNAVQISAKGDALWAVSKFGQILKYRGDGWSQVSGTAIQVAATSDGGAWAIQAISSNSANVLQFNSSSNGFANVPCTMLRLGILPVPCSFLNINAYNSYFQLPTPSSTPTPTLAVAVDQDGSIYLYNGTEAWRPLDGSSNVYHAALGAGPVLWWLDNNGRVFGWNGFFFNQVQAPSAATVTGIDVQSFNRVVATDSDFNAFVWYGSSWELLDGQECVQATIGATAVYCIGPNGAIYTIKK